MNKISIGFCLFIFVFSCTSASDFLPAENALDAAREYIDGTLKGNFKKADFYLENSNVNQKKLEEIKENYYRFNDTERQDYRNASIIIQKEKNISNDESVIYFQNSFDKKNDSLTVKNIEGKWQVTLNE